MNRSLPTILRVAALTLLPPALASGCAHPQLAVSMPLEPLLITVPGSDVAFYDVTGESSVDVVQSLVELAPGDGGVQHAAQTRWEVVWRYPGGPDDGSGPACDLDYVDLHVSVVTDFPRWQPPPDASPDDVREWYRYTGALARHEAEHAAIIDDLAGTVPQVIQRSDCAHADAQGQLVLDQIRHANSQLDTDTLDGASEGAALAWIRG